MHTQEATLKSLHNKEYYSFEEICRTIETGQHFTFARYGDGEALAIMKAKGANCDNHAYFPDMGDALADIMIKNPPYGLAIFTTQINISNQFYGWLNKMGLTSRKYSRSDVFHLAIKYQTIERFFEAINERGFDLIGPPHLQKLIGKSRWNITNFIGVPARDCWKATESVLERIEEMNPTGKILCFAASMAANVWIDRLYDDYGKSSTLIDAGSAFDPFAGVNQRSYHRKAQWVAKSKWLAK